MGWEVVSCWIESHPGLASWIQAIFSVIAIAAAGYFPVAHERRREGRERKNMLSTLGYAAFTLEKLIEGLSEALVKESSHRQWRVTANSRRIKIIGKALNDISAGSLVGAEHHMLADLRLAQECAVEIDDFLCTSSPGDIRILLENGYHYERCKSCLMDVQIAQEAVEALIKKY